MIPTLTSCTPSSGHTGGQCLIEVVGTNFALPAAPPATGPTPTRPLPSVRVIIGGQVCPSVWAVSSTLLRALTPIHDPSGIPQTNTAAAIHASDLVVENLDADGGPVPTETATLTQAYSFHRPVFNATVVPMVERAIKQLEIELARQVHPNVQFQPHTDYDAETGDGLNIVEFATLPGIGLTGLRLPTSKDLGDREQPEVDLGGGLVAVRRQPVIRDAILTCMLVSDSTGELLWLCECVRQFAQKNYSLKAQSGGQPLLDSDGNQVAWQLDYQRGEEVTFTDRQAGVEYATATFTIRRIQETDMPGISGVGTPGDALGLHEATVGLAYKVGAVVVGKQGGVV